MLAVTFDSVTAFLAALGTILSVVIIPAVAYIIKQHKKNKKRVETVDKIPEKLDKIQESMEKIQDDQNTIKFNQAETNHKMQKLENKFSNLETQQLKYIINDTFLSCGGKVEKIPYESLKNAEECARMYLAKGENHETGARCKIIFEEVERRATLRKESDK